MEKNERIRIERAIIFTAHAWEQSANNPKPTLFHSLRISFTLLDLGYPATYAELAVLHDILEDTSVTYGELSNHFGKETADLVVALSHRDDINDWEKRYNDMFQRVMEAGKMTTIVKMIDLADNSLYIYLVNDLVLKTNLIKKMKIYLDLTKIYSTEPAWQYLYSCWKKITTNNDMGICESP